MEFEEDCSLNPGGGAANCGGVVIARFSIIGRASEQRGAHRRG